MLLIFQAWTYLIKGCSHREYFAEWNYSLEVTVTLRSDSWNVQKHLPKDLRAPRWFCWKFSSRLVPNGSAMKIHRIFSAHLWISNQLTRSFTLTFLQRLPNPEISFELYGPLRVFQLCSFNWNLQAVVSKSVNLT